MFITILAALFTLGVVIFFHELGHFIMAKRVGVKVEKFSLGFGPKLFGVNYSGTEYLISTIPLGGYIKMKGEDTNEEPTGDMDEFCSRPLGDRAKIVFFGPFLNFFLAFFFFILVFMIGIPTLNLDNKVGLVKKDTLAYKEGIQKDDIITKVNNYKVNKWEEIEKGFMEGILKGKVILEIERGKKVIKKVLTISKEDQSKPLGIYPHIPSIVGKLKKGYPAEKVGLKEGDVIVKINNREVRDWNEMSEIISNSKEKPLDILIKRNEKKILVKITPILEEISSQEGMIKVGMIGISPQTKVHRYGVFESIKKAFSQLMVSIQYVFFVLWKLISGGISIKHLAGPLGIAQMAGQQAQSGLLSLVFFVAFLSVNLGVFNLLPIPVLDGGFLLFYAIEKLRGKAISIKAQEIASQVGLSVLMVLILFATFNDILRVFK
ncbi:MAG: RIP metalloprotease RseP [bacterium]|nr:RIP metalloprotease RseP [bacterium]